MTQPLLFSSICSDRTTMEPAGYAYVTFMTPRMVISQKLPVNVHLCLGSQSLLLEAAVL
mgnify:CR=1 FL=1